MNRKVRKYYDIYDEEDAKKVMTLFSNQRDIEVKDYEYDEKEQVLTVVYAKKADD